MFSVHRQDPRFLPMTLQEHRAFIGREEASALMTYNDDITDEPYTAAQRNRATQFARNSYLAFAPAWSHELNNASPDSYLQAVALPNLGS
jgi:hypothetical protein